MFFDSAIETLDLGSFDTSNTTNMMNMFLSAKATSINVSKLNTNKVTTMYYMFYQSLAPSLDLSSFNMSNVTNTKDMFSYAKATTGYARTQADADKFNSSSNKPSTLTFTVK